MHTALTHNTHTYTTTIQYTRNTHTRTLSHTPSHNTLTLTVHTQYRWREFTRLERTCRSGRRRLLLKRMMVAWVRSVREDIWDAAVSTEQRE